MKEGLIFIPEALRRGFLESLKKTGIRPQGIEGEKEGNWILLDYGEVILHVFHPVIRKYYDLEGLHSGSPIETWNDPA